MSHIVGTVQTLASPLHIGPDTGNPPTSGATWAASLAHTPAPGGTKFVILHFTDVLLPGGNRLEVDLGYDTDVFTAADGTAFWTRPVNVDAVGGGGTVPLRYITDGAASGGARVDRYARGESLQSHAAPHDSVTNCDPFLAGPWVEPVFPHPPGWTGPKYDPFWICDKTAQPRWANLRCAAAGDVRRAVGLGVGMIVTVHGPSSGHPHESVGTCSVTLIDADLVVLAGHCVSDHPFEVPTSSVTFDYEVACDGSVLPAYGARFFKVTELVKYRYSGDRDYAILQLRGAPGLPPVPVRNTVPAVGDPVFGVHHPNGAVKKVGPSAAGTVPVAQTGNMIRVNLDVAGGSSGSGLFDTAGRIVGVLASGYACNVGYSASATMLADPVQVPDPPTARRVMVVFDRSGSMSGSAGDGKVKISEARDAAALFVSMLRESDDNQAGLVSFSTTASSPVDFSLAPATAANKDQLLNLLPGITPGGLTTIGGGLTAARDQLSGAAGAPRAVLLLTDGMENTPPMIATVTGLAGIDITAIGFGTESNLDGPRLTELAHTHNGFYKRAGTGLELKKFFALAFGEIFEAGALTDPEHRLPARTRAGAPMPFSVCGEEAITVVVGWDAEQADLAVEIRTPSGNAVDLSSPVIERGSGRTWLFVRIPLPLEEERDGEWTATVHRAGGGVEFPPPAIDLTYFLQVIARGGARLRPLDASRRLYTGDTLNPQVMLQYRDETVPRGGQVELVLRRPAASVGTLLSEHGLGDAETVDGDEVPPRQATLSALEQRSGQPAVEYTTATYALRDDDAAATGTFLPAGVFGRVLEDALVVDGTYTFHARGRYGRDCVATRETQWSLHVTVGIDPAATDVVVEPAGSGPGGGDRVRLTMTPRDRYGNHLGPGAAEHLAVAPRPGCTLVGGLVDRGDGRYTQTLDCDPDAGDPPGVAVTQPGREPVVVEGAARPRAAYRYPVKIVCGVQPATECDPCAPVEPGRYATEINVLNPHDREVVVTLEVVPTVVSGAAVGRWPATAAARARDRIALQAGAATTVDCCSVSGLLLGAKPTGAQPLTVGFVVLRSAAELDVTAVYTSSSVDGSGRTMHVEPIRSQTRVPDGGRPPEIPRPRRGGEERP